MSRLLLDPWQGRQRLWIVFLFYWLAGQILIENLVHLFVPELNTAIRTTLIVNGIWAIYSCVSLWRCAFNVDWRWIGYLARVLAAVNLILLPIAFYLAIFGDFGNLGGPA